MSRNIGIDGLHDERQIEWSEVFTEWKRTEGERGEWTAVAQKKGWNTWEEWRGNRAATLDAENREWFLYRIVEPLKTVPQFTIGPTKSWQNNFPANEKNQHTFADAAQLQVVQENEKVRQIQQNFPDPTQLIGVVFADGMIVVLEGHHRASAIALAAANHGEVSIPKSMTIVLAFLEDGEEKTLDSMLERGSEKLST